MNPQKIDNVVAAVIIAYDAETGEPMYIHEELSEVAAEKPTPHLSCDDDRESEVREEARKIYPQRRIETLVTGPEGVPEEGMRLEIDPVRRVVRKIPDTQTTFLFRG